MSIAFFVSDLHGHIDRYKKLFCAIQKEHPAAIFFGGDLLPKTSIADYSTPQDFIQRFFLGQLRQLKQTLAQQFPDIFLILGNDDGRTPEPFFLKAEEEKLLTYIHLKSQLWQNLLIYGYSYIPPSPFFLKDWERFDVSRYVDPGCIAPEYGQFSVPISEYDMKYATIAEDLEKLTSQQDMHNAVFLFHSPPYKSPLDRAALDGKMIDHVPLDVHIGSIAIERFIKKAQPLLTLHGHVHESASITGTWRTQIGRTHAFTAAHHGPELALVRIDLQNPAKSQRELI